MSLLNLNLVKSISLKQTLAEVSIALIILESNGRITFLLLAALKLHVDAGIDHIATLYVVRIKIGSEEIKFHEGHLVVLIAMVPNIIPANFCKEWMIYYLLDASSCSQPFRWILL